MRYPPLNKKWGAKIMNGCSRAPSQHPVTHGKLIYPSLDSPRIVPTFKTEAQKPGPWAWPVNFSDYLYKHFLRANHQVNVSFPWIGKISDVSVSHQTPALGLVAEIFPPSQHWRNTVCSPSCRMVSFRSAVGLLYVTHVLEAIPNDSRLNILGASPISWSVCTQIYWNVRGCANKHTYPFRNPVAPESWGQLSSLVRAVGKSKKDFWRKK